jgi:hypothetical protein
VRQSRGAAALPTTVTLCDVANEAPAAQLFNQSERGPDLKQKGDQMIRKSLLVAAVSMIALTSSLSIGTANAWGWGYGYHGGWGYGYHGGWGYPGWGYRAYYGPHCWVGPYGGYHCN